MRTFLIDWAIGLVGFAAGAWWAGRRREEEERADRERWLAHRPLAKKPPVN